MIYRHRFGIPAWGVRNPFEELKSMRDEMDRLFGAYSGRGLGHFGAGVFPSINLSEDQGSYYVRAELPGIKAEELEIQVTANNVSISGERKITQKGDGVRYHRREREGGKFSRIVTLPGDIDNDKVDANLVNGVLTLKIAKAEAAKPKQINITS